MATKTVSKRYALSEFYTIGLILVIYVLFCLYIPILLDELFSIVEIPMWHKLNLALIAKIAVIVSGTLLSFMLIKFVGKKKKRIKQRNAVPFKEILVETLVFFMLCSLVIFVETAVAAHFNIPGELISPIGMKLGAKNLTSIEYIVYFVLIAPIIEEFAFRGTLIENLSKYGKYFALIASSILFGLSHSSFLEMIPATFMGYQLGKIYLRYNSSKPCMWIHGLFNLFLFFLLEIPEEYSAYMAILLALIYLITVVLILTKRNVRIIVKKPKNTSAVVRMFLKTPSIALALVLMAVQSLLVVLLY